MRLHTPPILIRYSALAVLAVAVLAASGCSWFRNDELYAQSPESRPLEVPPDLNLPDTSAAMAMPDDGTQSVTRSSMSTPAASAATARTPAGAGFTVPGDRDAVFAQVGEALAGIEGVTIASQAEILGVFDVDYGGSQFLLRVSEVQAGSYVSAVDPRGLPATGEAPTRLIAALKTALGG